MNLKKLSDSEKKVLTFWAILGVVIISGLLIFKLVAPDSFDRLFKLGEYDKKYKLVQDRTRYYTVSNSLIKYYEYSSNKDSQAVFDILNDNYKKNNNINSSSDIKFKEDQTNLTFNSRLMCQKKIKKGVYSFYVSGFESNPNVSGRLNVAYYEVVLDDNNYLFSVQPIDEKTFGGECHE